MSSVDNSYLGAEIDLRRLVKDLLSYKTIILIVVLAAILLGYLIGSVTLKKEYTSDAYIIMTELSFAAQFEDRIDTELGIPDVTSLIDLAYTDRVLDGVYQKAIQTPEGSKVSSPGSLRRFMNVGLVGRNQLRLEVTTLDPRLSMTLVNIWADELAALLNSLVGIDDSQIQQVQEQKALTYANWESAEQALVEANLDSKITLLEVSLEKFKDGYGLNLEKISKLKILISDAQSMKSRIEDLPSDTPLSVENKYSLVSMEQRAIGVESEDTSLTIQFSDIPDGEIVTVRQTRQKLDSFISSLNEQVIELQNGLVELEQQLAQTQNDLQEATRSRQKLITERDVALNSFEALANHEGEMQILQSKNSAGARVASYSVYLPGPSGTTPVMLAAISGVAVFAIAVFALLVRSWWMSPEKNGEDIYHVQIPQTTIEQARITKE